MRSKRLSSTLGTLAVTDVGDFSTDADGLSWELLGSLDVGVVPKVKGVLLAKRDDAFLTDADGLPSGLLGPLDVGVVWLEPRRKILLLAKRGNFSIDTGGLSSGLLGSSEVGEVVWSI